MIKPTLLAAAFAASALGQACPAPGQTTLTICSALYIGSSLNDLAAGGTWSGSAANHWFTVIVSSSGTPDQFRWAMDNGTLSAATNITGAAQTLSNGVTVTFGATTGHASTTGTSPNWTANFWIINIVASGTANSLTSVQPGFGATFRGVQDKLRDTVNVLDFGAVCDGVTDDTGAIQDALDSLPAIYYTAYGVWRQGVVEIPSVVSTTNGRGCLIGSGGVGLVQSPGTTIRAKGGYAVLTVAANFSPVVATYTVTGATNANPIVISTSSSVAGLNVNDTVVCSQIGGNLAANNYANTGNPWVIAAVTGMPNSFTLTASNGTSSGVWTGGGTCMKGTEKFAISVFNPSGPGTTPNNSFRTGLENVQINMVATGNEFASAYNCQCSIGTRLIDDWFGFGYRGLVITADSLSGDDLEFTPLFNDGPDPIGLDINEGNPTNSIALSNLKFTGFNGSTVSTAQVNYTPLTPAMVIGGQAQNIAVNVVNFEGAPWGLWVGGFNQDISITQITYGMDGICSGSGSDLIS